MARISIPGGGTGGTGGTVSDSAVAAQITSGPATQAALQAGYVPLTGNAVAQWNTSSDGTTRQTAAQAGATFAAVGGFPWQPITVDPGRKHQEILGFGCAITDSSAYLLQAKLTQAQRAALLAEVFDPAQGNCSLVRISMGASDYSLTAYTYDDQPSGVTDPNLNGFALGSADQQYKIATLREILRINPRVRIVAAPWSPPAWMKSNAAVGFVGSSVTTGNFAALASYFVKFVQAYASYGIPIYAVTPQNEPTQVNTWPSTLMTAADQATFIGTYLGPAFDTAGITTRIWAFDDSWATTYPNTVLSSSTAGPYVDGVGYHWYGGVPEYMNTVARSYPTKGQYITEACHTTGSPLTMATAYAKLFIGSIRNQAGCVILWNLALDESGGPRTLSTQVIHGLYTIPSSGSGAYTRNVDFYALTQTSRFVKPGAVRVPSSHYPTGVQSVAYLNPDNSVVLVAYNSSASAVTTQVIDARRGQAFPLTLPAGEVSTLVWSGVGAGSGSLPASAPAAPSLALTGKAGRVQVTITPPTSAVPLSGYTLSRGTATGQETILAALPPTATSFTDYTAAGTYFYTLTAYSAAGASSVSAEVSATATAATAPAATVLSVNGTNTTAALTWTVPDDGGSKITSYQVFRGTTAGVSTAGAPLATVPVVSGATYADSGLTAGTTYYYRVRAVNAVGNAADSNEVNYFASTRPAAPATTTQPALWLRSDQITGVANGASVSSWSDSLGHTAVPSTGATAPTFVASAVNNLPALQLRTASSQRMTVPFTIGAENVTILLVMRVPTTATQSFLAAATSDTKVNGTPTAYRDAGNLVHAQVQGTANSNCASGTGMGVNSWAVAAISYDTAANSHAEKSVVNGGTIGAYSPSAYTAGSAAGLAIGGVATDAGDLDIAELIVMPACLSDADRHAWTAYLGSVYGITVGAN